MINTREIATEYRLTHWSGVIKERNSSGMSIKAYCESIGLHQNVYFYWQRKLREAAFSELLPATVSGKEIAKAPNGWTVCGTAPTQSTTKGNGITIDIGKSRVTANTEVDLELLSNVCRMLMSLTPQSGADLYTEGARGGRPPGTRAPGQVRSTEEGQFPKGTRGLC